MSRGLSLYQNAILGAINEYGYVDILKAAMICSITKQKAKGKDKPTLWKFESVEEISNPGRLYRMMRSLENRGQVARLMHRRQAVWLKIIWEDGKPRPSDFEQFDLQHVRDRDGRLLFRTKGKTWEMKFPDITENQLRNQRRQEAWATTRWLNEEVRKRKTKAND